MFTLGALKEVTERTHTALQTSGSAELVKTLQMVRLEKTILAVGMFTVFDAMLQDRLNCRDGFEKAKGILKQKGEVKLLSRFEDLELAINALKHGRGKAHNALIAKDSKSLDFRVKKPDESFFNEGDVFEPIALVEVDDDFIYRCVEIINEVSNVI